jgi:hypothetical protein
MTRFLRRASLLLLASVVLVMVGDVATYDARAWTADLERVEADMAQGYANLDWIASKRGLDLVRLDRETRARLAGAHSRVRAFLAFKDFIAAFRDPHLKLEWGKRPITEAANAVLAAASTVSASSDASPPAAAEPPDSPAGADCAAAGYEEDDHGFALPFARLPGWRALGEADFPHGVAGDLGVLRIAQLGEDKYAGACARVFKPGIGARELQLAVRAHQQAQLRAALGALRQAGARRLLIDVSGNGGGSEWVSEVIALMTPKAMARAEARVVGPACDRRDVWRGKAACSVFAPGEERATLQGEGAWTGPVYVLADRGTASASESLVAWLKQNGVAKIVGERTLGAGCGYMDGGTRTQLRASHFDVRMPNCARFMEDGTNEIEGIAPDIALDMQSTDEAAKAQALAAALNRSDLIKAREARLN